MVRDYAPAGHYAQGIVSGLVNKASMSTATKSSVLLKKQKRKRLDKF